MHPSPLSSHIVTFLEWWEHLWSTLLADFKYIVDVIAQTLGCVQVFVTPWTAACQASLSLTISQSLLKFMSIESVMPSTHLILWLPLLLLSSVFPSIMDFSSEPAVCFRWPKYWSFSFSLCPSSVGSPLRLTGLISFCPRDFHESSWHHSSKVPILWHSSFFMVQLSQP